MNDEIILQGSWNIDNVLFTNEGMFTPSQEVKEAVVRNWDKFKHNHPGSFSGPLVRLNSWTKTHDHLHINTQSTDYATYIGTRDSDARKKYLERNCAQPLGMTVIPLTSDGKVVVTRRSLRLEQNPGGLYFIGGYLETGIDGAGKEETMWGDIKREAKEELNINPEEIVQGEFIGIAKDFTYFHPEVFVKLSLTLTSDVVLEKWSSAQDASEAEDVLIFDEASLITRYQNNDLPYPVTWSFKTGMHLGFNV